MEGNFGECKLWQNGKENIIGEINFGKSMTSLIKRILKQFNNTSAPNLNDVGWLLLFSVESKIRGYHKGNWSAKGNREIHTIHNFLSKYPSTEAVTPYSATLLPTSNR